MLIVPRLQGAGRASVEFTGARVVLTTEEPRFAPDPKPVHLDAAASAMTFERPGAVLLELPATRGR
jgi:hypothetical protein